MHFPMRRIALALSALAAVAASAATTGFWHVEKIDGRDWAVGPDGRPTVLAGVDWVWPSGFFCEKLGYSPYGRFVETNYPSREAWADETAARLHAWGFNFLGSGCDNALLSPRGLAHAVMLNTGNTLAHDREKAISLDLGRPGTAFPNVFHPDFEAAWDLAAARKAAQWRDDPNLLGYYLDNELSWAAGMGDRETGMFDAVAALPPEHSARKALEKFLTQRRKDAETRGVSLSTKSNANPVENSSASLRLCVENATRETNPDNPVNPVENNSASLRLCVKNATRETKRAFLALVAERYFSVAAEAIRRHDPNHMVLGCRFAGIGVHEEVLKAAARHCDIVTFNFYPWADLDRGIVLARKDGPPVAEVLREFHDKVGAPLLITEWSFSALDTGRPCSAGAGQRFRTQAERVEAAEMFARTLLSLPFMVGHTWFMWVDQPALGFNKYFHEDCNYGLVSEEGKPYEALTEMFARLHRDAAAIREGDLLSSACQTPATEKQKADNSEPSERDRFLAAAHTSAVAGAQSPAPPVGFRQEADGSWALSNAFIRLSGRIGSRSLVDDVVRDGRVYGRLGALLMTTAPDWPPITRLAAADFAADAATGCASVTLVGEGGAGGSGGAASPSFAITVRLTLAPSSPDILAEILSVQNLGASPLSVQKLFLCPFAAGDAPPERVPMPVNVWKGWNESWWRLADGARYGAVSHDESADGFNLWTESDGRQHADIPFRPLADPVTLAPGETLTAPRPMAARIRLLPAGAP